MKKIIGLFLVVLIPLYVSAGPDNIAPAAKVKASSSVPGYECQHVTDGIICIQDQGEWASNSSVSFYGSIDFPFNLYFPSRISQLSKSKFEGGQVYNLTQPSGKPLISPIIVIIPGSRFSQPVPPNPRIRLNKSIH